MELIDEAFGALVEYLGPVLFYEVYGFPLITLVLLIGALLFTVYFKFINIRGFMHSIDIIKGKYDNPRDTGQISHFQALTSALSATIGLGNIAGVAVAVSLGGPGAVFWMVFIAFFSMSAKFVSATLGQLYRKVNDDGSISGGPMYYLDHGLRDKGSKFAILGKILAVIYAVFIIGGAFGGGNMFQANQSYELFGKLIGIPDYIYGVILAALVAIVIVGGIKRIGKTTEKIVPFMVVLYVGASLFIILTNIERIPDVISSIFGEAFSPHAMYGGFIGALVVGVKRAVFSNEGGVGSASIAHSAAKTDEPVREGIVAMIGPFIDTIIVCFMTASVIVITAPENPIDTSEERRYIYDHIQELNEEHKEVQEDLIGKEKDLMYYTFITNTLRTNLSEIKSLNSDFPLFQNWTYYISIDSIKKEKDSTGEISYSLRATDTTLFKNSEQSLDSIKTTVSPNGIIKSKLYTNGKKFKRHDLIKIDNEIMLIDLVEKTWLICYRGYETAITEHNNGSDIHINQIKVDYSFNNNKITEQIQGAELTSAAFGTTISWFPFVLSIVVFLFSFSTMISWYYYGDKGWKYLFGTSSIKIYQAMYLGCIVVGSVASLQNVIDFSDMMILSCAFPNIIGCIFLLPLLKEKLNEYWNKYNNKEFKVYK